MFSFAKQLEKAIGQVEEEKQLKAEANADKKRYPKPKKENPNRVRNTERAQADYEKQFGGGNTVAKASAAMGVSHVGCLNQVYRYEKKGLMHRKLQRDPATGGIIFYWGPAPQEGN